MVRVPENKEQIIRIDNRDTFIEAMATGFHFGKLIVAFNKYDQKKPKGERLQSKITIFIDTYEALALMKDILSGRMARLGQKSLTEMQQKGGKYAGHIYQNMGGTSAGSLRNQQKSRPDGKAESRILQLSPGNAKPWLFTAMSGPGEQKDNGLISPNWGAIEERLRVAMTDDEIKEFAIAIQTHIEGYVASNYINEKLEADMEAMKEQLDMMKPIMNGLTTYLRQQNVAVNFPPKETPPIQGVPNSRKQAGQTQQTQQAPQQHYQQQAPQQYYQQPPGA